LPKSAPILTDAVAKTRDEWFYIDTIPVGVNVSEVREGKDDVSLGITPLRIKLPPGQSKKIWLVLDIRDYLKKIDSCPDLREWKAHFQSELYFGDYSSPFTFPSPESRLVKSLSQELLAIGPVLDI
jgi:hypothetical protein